MSFGNERALEKKGEERKVQRDFMKYSAIPDYDVAPDGRRPWDHTSQSLSEGERMSGRDRKRFREDRASYKSTPKRKDRTRAEVEGVRVGQGEEWNWKPNLGKKASIAARKGKRRVRS